MRLHFTLHASIDDETFDPRLAALLVALKEHGSIAAAARTVGVSYRFAWDRLRNAETVHGHPLVRMQRGRGADLTSIADALLDALARARAETAPMLGRIARDFEAQARASNLAPETRLRFAASHDLALIELKAHCAEVDPRLDMEIQFRGSLDALAELARGRCDFAGFHVGPEADGEAEIRRALPPRTHRLVILGERTQGLMFAAGNPKRLARIDDLARRGVRFVNRQPGSGTRLLFDRLLAESGIRARDIRGYQTEEFTHVAVAATVASGHADAGFGIHAAAARYGLAFVPLSSETYYLAAKRSLLERPAARKLLQHMRARDLRRRLSRLKGYRLQECGTLVETSHAFRALAS